MSEYLKVGDTVVAQHSTKFPDYVTEGKEYKVTKSWETLVGGIGFLIVNDIGVEIMPISVGFRRKGDK